MSNIHELIEQKNRLQAEIDAIKNNERQAVIDSVKASIAEFDIKASELGFKGKGGKGAPRGPVKPKYNINGNLWAGRGGEMTWPQFVKDAVAQYGSIEAVKSKFAITE